jgi:XTP/dITP diphosphohydrolase
VLNPAGRLTVLVTSPRLPAGLLSGSAWTRLREADLIVSADPGAALPVALGSEGVEVEAAHPFATELLTLATGHEVVWLAGDDGDDELMRQLATEVVSRAERGDTGPTVEVVAGSFDPVGARLLDLVEVMDRLRAGCPWDRRQTHESLVRYLVEETYETIEAIETGDRDHLREELGDLLLQVVFHARLAEEHEDEPFGIDEVAAGIVEKLIRRHPHVFAGETLPLTDADADATDVMSADGVQTQWDQIKATEKSRTSVLDGIPPGLPALSLAAKLLERAPGRASLPPSDAGDVPAHTEQSLGEALFSLVAQAQAAGLDPEQALRRAVRHEMAQVLVQEQRATPAASPERR